MVREKCYTRAMTPLCALVVGIPSASATALLAWCAVAAPLAAQDRRPALDRVLKRWIIAYERGVLDLRGLALVKGKADPIYGHGWLDRGGMLDLTHRAGLQILLDEAAKLRTVELAQLVLRLAARGLLDGSASFQRPHFSVRRMGHLALGRFTSTDAMFLLMQTAAGDFRSWQRRPVDREGIRAAAILALGAMDKPVVRPTLQRQLRSDDAIVRLAAAEALGQMRHPGAIRVLTRAMRTENHPIVAQALVKAVDAVLARHAAKVDVRDVRKVLGVALDLLGRTDWRTDLEIVEFLGKVRNVMSVPALIAVLEREPDPKHEKNSNRLRAAAHETLRSLTGAIIPADQPQKWREYWEREKDSFVLAPVKKLGTSKTAAGFFGIPVQGSNVVFIIDISGSMRAGFFPAGDYKPDAADDGLTRLEMAKRELVRAVDALPRDSRFNVVSFATDVRRWKHDLVRAGPNNRRSLVEKVRRMQPAGATNIFGALKSALEIKTLTFGARYGVQVDEVFLLSDGEPTAGEVVDTKTILQLIHETNRYSMVKINTLYMGGGGDSRFMQDLAEQNGGRYVRL